MYCMTLGTIDADVWMITKFLVLVFIATFIPVFILKRIGFTDSEKIDPILKIIIGSVLILICSILGIIAAMILFLD